MKPFFALAALASLGLALSGCSSIRDAAGINKAPPDEFAVVTKAPLVIPPDFNLRPPKPGAAPTNQSSPTDSAQTALFGDDPATVAASLPTTYSNEERYVLASTGAAGADHGIRQQIAADSKSMETATGSFTDTLLFRSAPDPNAGHQLDADAEHDRLAAKKSGDDDAADDKSDESATINKDGGEPANNDSSHDGGWLDGIF
jgi:hypothetical protein